MSETGKGQLVSSGDAGLAIRKCRRFPAVLLASASPGNKTEIIITVSWISGSGILNITLGSIHGPITFVFLLATLALKMTIIWVSNRLFVM